MKPIDYATPTSTVELSEMLDRVHSKNYANKEIDAIIEYGLPLGAKLISAELSNPDRSEELRDKLQGYRDFGAKKVVIPVCSDNDCFTGVYLRKNDDGSYNASYIDPRGGEEKTLFEKTTKQLSEYVFGKAETSEVTAKSYLGPIPHHLVELLEDVLSINPQDIAVTTNKLQHSIMNGYGIRETTNNHSGAIVADILTSLANDDIAVSGSRLTERQAQGSNVFVDISDRSEDSSKILGEVLRIQHFKTLMDIYPDQARELEALGLETDQALVKNSSKKKENADISGSKTQNQVGGGFSAGRVLDLMTKAAIAATIVSTNNNQEGGIISPLAVGGNQFGNNLRIGSGRVLSGNATNVPTSLPTAMPSISISAIPTVAPTTAVPTTPAPTSPTSQPTINPTGPTTQPSLEPTAKPKPKDNHIIDGIPNEVVYAGAAVGTVIVGACAVAAAKVMTDQSASPSNALTKKRQRHDQKSPDNVYSL